MLHLWLSEYLSEKNIYNSTSENVNVNVNLWDENKAEGEEEGAVLGAAAWRLLVAPDAVLNVIVMVGNDDTCM